MAAMTSRYLGRIWHGGRRRRAYIQWRHEGGGTLRPARLRDAGIGPDSGAEDDLAPCRYFSVPLWTPTRSAAKRFGAELAERASVGWAKARSSRAVPTGKPKVGTLRFAHPTAFPCGRADAGQAG